MKGFGILMAVAGAGAVGLAIMVAVTGDVRMAEALIALGGFGLLLGAILLGCGTVGDRLEETNKLLTDIRNQGCAAPEERLLRQHSEAERSARLGRWPATSWQDGPG